MSDRKIKGKLVKNFKQISMGLALISVLTMTACGSLTDTIKSGDGSTDTGSTDTTKSGGGSTDTTEKGIFVDAPVMGLHYKTDTLDGYTDENGTYKYESGEDVEFLLGDLSLGKVEAGAIISPYTLAGVEDKNDSIKDANNHATNIALLLQSLDLKRDDNNILDLSKFIEHKFTKIDFTKASDKMHEDIKALMNEDGVRDKIAQGAEVLDLNKTIENMREYVKRAIEGHKKLDKLSDMYDKKYINVICSELKGCVKGRKIFQYLGEDKSIYNVVDGTTVTLVVDDERGETGKWYMILSDTNANVVNFCEGTTLDKAKACSVKSTFVLASVVDKYIQAKSKKYSTKNDNEDLKKDDNDNEDLKKDDNDNEDLKKDDNDNEDLKKDNNDNEDLKKDKFNKYIKAKSKKYFNKNYNKHLKHNQ
jgi:hypothetical protein